MKKPANRSNVAIYCRVSTDRQNLETQFQPLRSYANSRNFRVYAEYSDFGVSGTKSRRPGLDALLKAARAKEFDVVLVARFDRFARSVSHLVQSLEEFNALGIDFISQNESIDTSLPTGKMVFTVLAAVAELERAIIVERITAGVNRARKEGKRLGRPIAIFDRVKAKDLRKKGVSIRRIAELLKTNRETVRQFFKNRKETTL